MTIKMYCGVMKLFTHAPVDELSKVISRHALTFLFTHVAAINHKLKLYVNSLQN